MASENPDRVTLPPVRRLGVENWKPEDFAEERQRRALTEMVYESRKTALEACGWTWVHRCSCQGGNALEDPSTGEQVPFEEACRRQEEREPGCIAPWPVFDNGWEPPSSAVGLIHQEVLEVKPMEPMKGPGIFGLQMDLGEGLVRDALPGEPEDYTS